MPHRNASYHIEPTDFFFTAVSQTLKDFSPNSELRAHNSFTPRCLPLHAIF